MDLSRIFGLVPIHTKSSINLLKSLSGVCSCRQWYFCTVNKWSPVPPEVELIFTSLFDTQLEKDGVTGRVWYLPRLKLLGKIKKLKQILFLVYRVFSGVKTLRFPPACTFPF